MTEILLLRALGASIFAGARAGDRIRRVLAIEKDSTIKLARTGSEMRANRSSEMMLRSASQAVIKTVGRRRLRLYRTDYRPVTCRKALPLDFTESKPFESSLDRNIEAILSEPTCC